MNIWKNGEFLDGDAPSISHRDSAFSNGIGVFDTMLAINEDVQDFDLHMERLRHDASVVLRKKIDTKILAGVVHKLLRRNGLGRGFARIKTVVSVSDMERPLVLSGDISIVVSTVESADPESLPPLRCKLLEKYPRIAGDELENCKRLDYSRSYAARADAIAKGADDAIMLNTDGNIACATTSNIFIREDSVFYTPPLKDGVLAGITRGKILDGIMPLPGADYAMEESISVERFKRADEIFVTNSFFGIRKVILA